MAAQQYRDEAAATLLRVTWSLPRKELLVSRQLKDAEETLQKCTSKREAAAQKLQEAREALQDAEEAEVQATNRVTELRVELETAQRQSAKSAQRDANARTAAAPADHTIGDHCAALAPASVVEKSVACLPTDDTQALQVFVALLQARPALLHGLRAADAATGSGGGAADLQAETEDVDAKRRKTDPSSSLGIVGNAA